jgi:hypothetical protein
VITEFNYEQRSERFDAFRYGTNQYHLGLNNYLCGALGTRNVFARANDVQLFSSAYTFHILAHAYKYLSLALCVIYVCVHKADYSNAGGGIMARLVRQPALICTACVSCAEQIVRPHLHSLIYTLMRAPLTPY